MSRVVRFHGTGGPEVMRLEELPCRNLDGNEIRIRVRALGLNRAEAMFRGGTYLEQPRLPSGLGHEAAGLIDAVGPGGVRLLHERRPDLRRGGASAVARLRQGRIGLGAVPDISGVGV